MISLENISKRYSRMDALAPITHVLAEGKTTVLIGPSGCGKSTLLRIMLGLIAPDTGAIRFNGQPVTKDNVQQFRHSVGYVIQDGGLFPHLTAGQNVTLLAKFLKRDPAEIKERVSMLGQLAQLSTEALARYPVELSGGQRQRVGLMRALMLDPQVLFLDEPLGALDPITRNELQTQLKSIFEELKKTVVLVTHDMGEAAYFADEIMLMRQGKVVQKGTVDDLINRPGEAFVTEFISAQRAHLPPPIQSGPNN